jgi:hypothetical protein
MNSTSRNAGLAQASNLLDQKLIAAGLKHTPTAIERAGSIIIERKAQAAQSQIDNSIGTSAQRAVANSYFGGAR